jgi:hypothetical protein
MTDVADDNQTPRQRAHRFIQAAMTFLHRAYSIGSLDRLTRLILRECVDNLRWAGDRVTSDDPDDTMDVE